MDRNVVRTTPSPDEAREHPPNGGSWLRFTRPRDRAATAASARSWHQPSRLARVTATLGLRRVEATRYVTPLREGGSLPALVEASDDGLYVLKFSGAGQGRKALVAEVVAGELARGLGLLVPELALVELDPALGRA